MTPAITIVKQDKVPFLLHEYDHDPSVELYGPEAAEKLGVDPRRVFKTLIATINVKDYAVGVLPVSMQLDLKLFAHALEAKKAALADGKAAERITGYVLGGVSPLGQRKKLKTIIDDSATRYPTIFVSAGRRGLQIELSPKDLAALTKARLAAIGK
ncbi:MAG: Cys-tRNA(Pro) deacylase [Chitinivibrionales bacterium]|nr:Cys-tRNA(Pro) deacylase [Chitinivibrionales bacterium]MBD3358037.1 Cys-tRNA(Pro) deacylase [Chitinivibrionales bacterium]